LLYLTIAYCVVGLKVAVGLGFVIFVHELGHFLVAKLCGVKCEKFYLGFDIAGLKFCKAQWGETEYGIGILPLGGYVKMLGQEDNPAKIREEMERAKTQGQGLGTSVPSQTNSGANVSSPIYDPRSFLAQSVPKRMAIISAGVVMNVIFAFVMAVVAFSLGVEQLPCVIGQVFPGEPAWQADLRVGDEILEIAGKKMTQFRDLQTAISLGDIDVDKGVPMLVRRTGVSQPFTVIVRPDRSRGAFFIGVANGKTNRLMVNRKTWLVQNRSAVVPGSAAAEAKPAFRNGDLIVAVDHAPVRSYADFVHAALANPPGNSILVSIERAAENAHGKSTDKAENLLVSVAANPMRTLGLAMAMGEITAVQKDSPAAQAGILPGDVIQQIDGRPVADPMTLPGQLAGAAGKTVKLTIQRQGSKSPVIVPVQLHAAFEYSPPEMVNSPLAVNALGVAYRVLNRIEDVAKERPAAKAGLLPGDDVVAGKLIPPDKETRRKWHIDQPAIPLSFGKTECNWPSFITALQSLLPGTTVQLTVLRQGTEKTVTMAPVEDSHWFNPDRGFMFDPLTFERKVRSVGDLLAFGGRWTLDDMTIVFRSVGKLSTNQVSPKNLIGPWGLLNMLMLKADQGNAELLLFLTFLSANLAVINFLPIPLLDGGHFVLLAYEGIRGKPASENVQVVLTYIGLIFIIVLLVWTLGLDSGLISRR
jgi:regulator of sigma E protease